MWLKRTFPLERLTLPSVSQKKRLKKVENALCSLHKKDHKRVAKMENDRDNQKLVLPSKVYHDQDGIRAYPQAPIFWSAQSVHEWIESFATATEKAEIEAGEYRDPLSVYGVELGKHHSFQNSMEGQNQPQRLASIPEDVPTDSLRWDLSYFGRVDPASTVRLGRIAQYASYIESHAAFHRLHTEYELIQNHLHYIFGQIMHQYYATPIDQMRSLLDTLYDNILQKLQRLADKAKAFPVNGKQDLSSYMTHWLQENWTNPYPDDNGLVQMAADCNTTTTIVSNWLINARTRKWRPAIIKATQLNRPAEMLLEDSINIFEGKPVRDLETVGDIRFAL